MKDERNNSINIITMGMSEECAKRSTKIAFKDLTNYHEMMRE
jgi:hypothetical protein